MVSEDFDEASAEVGCDESEDLESKLLQTFGVRHTRLSSQGLATVRPAKMRAAGANNEELLRLMNTLMEEKWLSRKDLFAACRGCDAPLEALDVLLDVFGQYNMFLSREYLGAGRLAGALQKSLLSIGAIDSGGR